LQFASLVFAHFELAATAVILPPKNNHRTAFSLVETLMMLVALVLVSLTSFAMLKKDQFSAKVILSKFTVDTPDTLPSKTMDKKISPLPGK